ncbi:MAG TPA: hypothetical protein VK956_19165 [Verrucomicrobium sp.]|nr:hypothetical protein [Verrucomicrobium sp.]
MSSRLVGCLLLLPLLLVLLGIPACREKMVPGAELQVVAERTATSKPKKPEDVVPYDDALVWHEYTVKKVLFGKCAADKIRVAHWSVAGAKSIPLEEALGDEVTLSLRHFGDNPALEDVAQSDDLGFAEDLPRYIDLGQTLVGSETPEALRLDYSGFYSEQMRLYWKLRPQLRLVAMGNSLVTKGVSTRLFYPGENEVTPVTLNLAPAGANNTMQCLIVREYVLPLPKLEWVVWGISPRAFNSERSDPAKLDVFLASPGWNYDQEHESELWPVPAPVAKVTVSDLHELEVEKFDLWGWEGRQQIGLPGGSDAEKTRAYIKSAFKEPDFSWGEARWQEFVETVKALNAKGVKVMLISTPMHPMVKDAPAADPDWTSREGMAQMVQRLGELDSNLPLSWYRDYNKAGSHEFLPDDFFDADHLNGAGAKKLTGLLVEWKAECEIQVK